MELVVNSWAQVLWPLFSMIVTFFVIRWVFRLILKFYRKKTAIQNK